MKTLLISAFLIFSFVAFAQKKEFVDEYTYTAGDRDSKNDCYDITKSRLRGMLIDKAGVYVRSESVLRTSEVDGKYSQDYDQIISTISSAVTEFKVIDQKWDGKTFWMKAILTIDTTILYPNHKSIPVQKVEALGSTLLKATTDDQYVSLEYSKANQQMYVATRKGDLIIMKMNSVLKTLPFGEFGTVSLDFKGELGAFTTENVIYIFNQKTLTIVDSIKLSMVGQGSAKVWFTNNGVYVSTFTYVYKYENKKLETVAKSYTVLDYDPYSDQFLLGYWDRTMASDRKVQRIYMTEVSLIQEDNYDYLYTVDRSFEANSCILSRGSYVMSYDGKGNYYNYSVMTGKKTLTIQEGLSDEVKLYSLIKVDNNIVMVAKHNALSFTVDNINKYGLKAGDRPTEFIFKRSYNSETVKSVIVSQGLSKDEIVVTEDNTIYFLSSGGNGNKLIYVK